MNDAIEKLIVVEKEKNAEEVLFYVGPVKTKDGWKELFIDKKSGEHILK